MGTENEALQTELWNRSLQMHIEILRMRHAVTITESTEGMERIHSELGRGEKCKKLHNDPFFYYLFQ